MLILFFDNTQNRKDGLHFNKKIKKWNVVIEEWCRRLDSNQRSPFGRRIYSPQQLPLCDPCIEMRIFYTKTLFGLWIFVINKRLQKAAFVLWIISRLWFSLCKRCGGRNHHRKNWSGLSDLNTLPPTPKAGALPDCANPRCNLVGTDWLEQSWTQSKCAILPLDEVPIFGRFRKNWTFIYQLKVGCSAIELWIYKKCLIGFEPTSLWDLTKTPTWTTDTKMVGSLGLAPSIAFANGFTVRPL